MENSIILNDFNFKIDKKEMIQKLCVRKKDKFEFLELLQEAEEIADPKAIFTRANIQRKSENYVLVENIKFCSRILAVNLKDTYKVFPYLVTAGVEIEKWSEEFDDILIKYWLDIIKEEILKDAQKELFQVIDQKYHLIKAAHMNPGSLRDWPITEQKKLFNLFQGKAVEIGIELSESMLMYPSKSVSGIRFLTEVDYENCQLCKRENCPGRSASYQPELLKEFF